MTTEEKINVINVLCETIQQDRAHAEAVRKSMGEEYSETFTHDVYAIERLAVDLTAKLVGDEDGCVRKWVFDCDCGQQVLCESGFDSLSVDRLVELIEG